MTSTPAKAEPRLIFRQFAGRVTYYCTGCQCSRSGAFGLLHQPGSEDCQQAYRERVESQES